MYEREYQRKDRNWVRMRRMMSGLLTLAEITFSLRKETTRVLIIARRRRMAETRRSSSNIRWHCAQGPTKKHVAIMAMQLPKV